MSYMNPLGAHPTDLVNANELYNSSRWPVSDCSKIDSGDVAWMQMSMAFVFFMTPGLAFFYGGFVHRKGVITIMMQCMISLGIVSMIWFLFGFGLAYGESAGHVIGNPSSFPLFLNLDFCTPAGYPMAGQELSIPGLLFAGYQLMFAVITPSLIAGAIADRIQFVPYLIFISLWVILVYCPFAHWIWNPAGFFAEWGIRDFAGGIVVHMSAGFASLAGIAAVGNRKWDDERHRAFGTTPHNRPFVMLGAAMIWFGWFGDNGGSAYGIEGGQSTFAVVNSCISASAAMSVWVLIDWVHIGKPSMLGAIIGSIVGLATVTPAAGFIRPWAAFLLGTVSAPWCYGWMEFRKVLRWDDALDVWGLHGMGGFLGSVMVGALADEEISGFHRSGTLFGKQLACCLFCGFYSFAISYLLLRAIDLFLPLLPTQDQLRSGLDVSLHGESAYDEDPVIKKSFDESVAMSLSSERAFDEEATMPRPTL